MRSFDMSEPNWTDPALVFPRPEDAPLIGEYAFITAASVATQVLYLNGYPANKLKNGGANFYTQQDGTVSTKSPTQPPVKPPTKPPVEPAWEPAKSYASSSKMVSDLMTHHFPNQVLLDGGQVIQFANGFGPPLQYFTHPDYSVKQTQPAKPVKPPTTDLPAQPPTVGGLVVLPWGGEVRTGEQGAPSMGGDSIYMLSLTVPRLAPRSRCRDYQHRRTWQQRRAAAAPRDIEGRHRHRAREFARH